MIPMYCKGRRFTLTLRQENSPNVTNMKLLLILLFLAIFALHLQAQQMISVIDHDSRKPVWRAYFIQNGDTIAYTSPEGIALVPKHPGKVTIKARDYKSVTFNSDSIPGVVHLKSELEQLEEITVIGDKNKVKQRHEKWDYYEPFKARKPQDWLGEGAGASIDDIIRLFGYKPASERRRNRINKNLEAYDKASPTPPSQTK